MTDDALRVRSCACRFSRGLARLVPPLLAFDATLDPLRCGASRSGSQHSHAVPLKTRTRIPHACAGFALAKHHREFAHRLLDGGTSISSALLPATARKSA